MSKNKLEILFDSGVRLKILKLLFRNSDDAFTIKEAAFRVQEKQQLVRKEMQRLLAIGLLKKQKSDVSKNKTNI